MAFWHKIFKKKKEEQERYQKSIEKKSDTRSGEASGTSSLVVGGSPRAILTPQVKLAPMSGVPMEGRKTVGGILLYPHITEKTNTAGEENKSIFSVASRANKIGVRSEIENRYGVKVVSVNILNMPRKERKRGRVSGWKPGFKKAVVKVKEGQKIEIQ